MFLEEPLWAWPMICSLFVFRNTKKSPAHLRSFRRTMPSILRGERSGSGQLPQMRRNRICCEAGGNERQIRWRRLYPIQMSRLRRHGPEAPHPTFDRRLTARPAVLAKTFGYRAVTLPVLTVDGPGRTLQPPSCARSYSPSGDTGSLWARFFEARGRGLQPVAPVLFGPIKSLVGRLQNMFWVNFRV